MKKEKPKTGAAQAWYHPKKDVLEIVHPVLFIDIYEPKVGWYSVILNAAEARRRTKVYKQFGYEFVGNL